MTILNELFKGLVILSFLAVIQNGCSVKNMAKEASKAHEKGLSSYGNYSRTLNGVKFKE